ncbi:MAG: transporter substrate-binding domain-containing protein [Salibacteraceae bacterium]|jgi:membrane-bound lytic murein transglycosylase F|nr:transporter substrate-binding domain-containing protein [Salibacteraceae bacterium]MDP4685880.1 transporter substrate-binding domain-containing protein [Salibacteraceae bacterium]MDP4762706.1 transporter substrate-binding domain-containing protein [Salibacteraceae bacterium]MDP4843949.1 transporter substrate-binding domain-containing protein [Salibacteraceae bacterium]
MKVTHRFLFIAFFTIALSSGCSNNAEKQESAVAIDTLPARDLPEILADKKLVALTEFSSYNYFIYKGVPMGFDYELLERFAKHLGVELSVVVVNDMDNIMDRLRAQEGDLIAANFTITKERAEAISFSKSVMETRQVLVQRLPEKHWTLSAKELDKALIRKPSQLIGKTIHTRKGSSFYARLMHLMEEVGDSIHIKLEADLGTEQLIEKVATGEFDYTVMDENIALLNKSYYPNIDIKTALSLTQRIAWATRLRSPMLLDTLNAWLTQFKKTEEFAVIYMKYFKARTQHKARVLSEYSSLGGDKISPFDDLIKEESKRLDWDWKLLAAVIYEESKFVADAESWTGAGGLMQLIPETAERFGADSIADPVQNIHAGVGFLKTLEEYWSEEIPDSNERVPFVLASYNVGLGHMLDAVRLTEKYGSNKFDWNEVQVYLALKADPEYYKDEVVKHGYCRGAEPVVYVKDILTLWSHYQNTGSN